MHPDWARSIRDQCVAAGVPFFFKQWGEFVSVSEVEGPGAHHYFPDGATVRRVGKKAAGRLLDGREWNEYPETAASVAGREGFAVKRWLANLGQCDKCPAPIVWATNRDGGARTPLDPEPNGAGGNLLLDDVTMSFVRLNLPMIERAIERGQPLYSNHLATCEARKAEAA